MIIKRQMNEILCADCLDTGWLENREEGRYPCTCITEMEPYQLLQTRCAELEKEIARLKTVPMMYRRMEYNAQLQDENDKLIAKCSSLENCLEQTSITLGDWIEKCAELEAAKIKETIT